MYIKEIPTADDLLNNSNYITMFWNDVFEMAHKEKASDIHIEPNEPDMGSLRVRFRVHGDLFDFETINDPKNIRSYLTEFGKICSIDLSERMRRQDKSIYLNKTNSRYRVSMVPATSYDPESYVLRVISLGDMPSLKNCKFSKEAEQSIFSFTRQSQGLFLVTGATGSGKTSTLHAILMAVKGREKRKILSLEDPIERRLPGVRQQEISPIYTWEEGLRSFMRQDPNIILVGEIRDEESAKLTVDLANTGHLVFSTMHTNNVIETYQRLQNFHVDKLDIIKSLKFCSAQRLVQTLCEHCKIKDEATGYYRKGIGCDECKGKIPGISGMRPILEYSLGMSDEDYLEYEKTGRVPVVTTLDQEMKNLIKEGVVDMENAFLYGDGTL